MKRAFVAGYPLRMGVPAPVFFRSAFCAFLLPGLFAGAAESAFQPSRPLIVVTGEATREVPVRRIDGVEMVGLQDLASVLGGALREDPGGDSATLLLGDRTARFDRDRSFVTVEDRMRVLREPSRVISGEWFVALDFVARLLPDVLPGDSEYQASERVLFRGASTTVAVEISRAPGATRITVRTDPPVPLFVGESEGRVLIPIPVPFLETDFGGEAPRDGVVEEVRLLRRERDYLVEVVTGPNYSRMDQEAIPGGVRLDLIRAAVRAGENLGTDEQTSGAASPRDRGRPVSREVSREVRTVVIDPGHGGGDQGVLGSSGFTEKELALRVSRALRDILQEEYGLRVILTREQDREVGPDDRAAFANAARADAMVSIHLNASLGGANSGSYVYYYAPRTPARLAAPGPASFVRWENSQLSFSPESRRLAEALFAELGELPVPTREVAGAPLLALGRVAMPAALIELGFLTSPEDEPHLTRPGFAREAARAIAAGLMRYRALIVATE